MLWCSLSPGRYSQAQDTDNQANYSSVVNTYEYSFGEYHYIIYEYLFQMRVPSFLVHEEVKRLVAAAKSSQTLCPFSQHELKLFLGIIYILWRYKHGRAYI